MRGKRAALGEALEQERITPAHAGKTNSVVTEVVVSADHPRACGENTSEMAYFRG